MKNIDYKKLKRYDVGKQVINNGYQLNTNNSPLLIETIKENESARNLINQTTLNNVTSVATNTMRLANLFNDLYKYNLSYAQANDASQPVYYNGATYANNAAVLAAPLAAISGNGVNTASTVSFIPSVSTAASDAGTIGGTLGTEAVVTGSSNAANAASSAGSALSTASSVLPYIGIVNGLANGIMGGIESQNTINGSDILQMTGKQILYVDGVPYEVNTGFDAGGLRSAMSRKRTGSLVNTMLSDTGLGASLGTTIVPGLGTAIGAAAGLAEGAIRGLVLNLFAKNKVNNAIQTAIVGQEASNRMAESVARNQANKNKFLTRAAKGMSAYEDKDSSKYPEYGIVLDSKGVHYGPINSLISGGEWVQDVTTGEAYKAKGPNKDVIPSTAQPNDSLRIFSNKLKNPITGNTFSKDFELNPLSGDVLELLQKEEQMKKTNLIRKYAGGKNSFVSNSRSIINSAGLFNMLGQLLLLYNHQKETPTTYNAYVPNSNANAAYALLGQHISPYNALQSINDLNRQSIYSINKSPYAAGQRMAMLLGLLNNVMKNRSDVITKYDEYNKDIDKALASAMLQYGESDAQRHQPAKSQAYDYYARSKANRDKRIDTDYATMYKNMADWANNLFNVNATGENIALWREDLEYKRQAEADKTKNQISVPTHTLAEILRTSNPTEILRMWNQRHMIDNV